jgi:two-component system, chemotaxis family, chemotaxis protein CheY
MKVLITDDSITIRMILKGLLKQLKIVDVVEADNGRKALELLKENPVHLMLLDIHMPNMDGLGCLQELRSNPETAGLPVIIVSSDTTPDQIKRAKELGAHAYISKPFRLEGLREALAELKLDPANA